jgi:hypothetical protein
MPIANQTWINLCQFKQKACKRRLTLGTITSAQGGYTQSNRLASLTTNKDSNNDTDKNLAGTINLHMVNLLVQMAAIINEHTMQTNASLQKLVANKNQLAINNRPS